MSGEYIFTMQGLIKRYGRNEVLNGINLSFIMGQKSVSLVKTVQENPHYLKLWLAKIKSLKAKRLH